MKYFDTSAFVKYYGNSEFEKGIDKVKQIIENAKKGEEIIVMSVFALGEIVSVFDRWIRIRAITEDEFSKIVSRFFSDIEELTNMEGLIIESISPLSIVFSIEQILKHHVSINDALHIYTALTSKYAIDEFVSSDIKRFRIIELPFVPKSLIDNLEKLGT